MKKKLIIPLILLLGLTNLSCSAYQTFVNLSRLKFKLGTVNNFQLLGIPLDNKKALSDFSPIELLRITASVAKGQLPVSFTLNVDANNPNDGSGGYPQTSTLIKSFPWRLAINDKETVSGNISKEISVPGTGQNTTFGLQINMDLYKFFQDKGYQSLVNLALNLGGQGGSASKITLFAQPTVSSPLGDIQYPQELKIVDFAFSK